MVKDSSNDKGNGGKEIPSRRHYPPAYYRYRKNHPTISIVLTKELKSFLDGLKRDQDVSYSEVLRKLVGRAFDADQARAEEFNKGYNLGLQKGQKGVEKLNNQLKKYRAITLGECSCGKPLVFHPDDPKDIEVLKEAVSRHQVIHYGCPQKPYELRVTMANPSSWQISPTK